MADRYASERFTPGVPACGPAPFSLQFDGRRLTGVGTSVTMIYPAVSGRAVDGKFDYSQARQKLADAGPIPAGEYWIQPSELQENAWYRLRNPRPAWGDFWITIHPYPSTQTHGRGGFFIHGGSTPGSAGCVDLSVNMNRFADDLAKELEGKSMCFIALTVRYAK